MTIEVPGERNYLKRSPGSIESSESILDRKLYEPLSIKDLIRKPGAKL